MGAIALKQGEQKIITVAVIDDAGNPIDMSVATKLRAVLTVNNQVVAKYSLVALSGYGTLTVNSTNKHQVEIQVRREESRNFLTGLLKASLIVERPEAVLGTEIFEKEFEIGSVLVGNTKEESL